MKLLRALSLLFTVVFLSVVIMGCGYSTHSLLPSRFKTIYVDNFKNKIDIGKEVTESSRYTLYRPGLENDVTNAIVDRFVFDGNLKVAKKEDADIILKGDLIDYRQEALRYDNVDNVEEYRIKVTVDVDGYRKQQENRILLMAKKAAEQVKKSGKVYRFYPMPARERRLIHISLKNNSDVETFSEGDGGFRKVVIKPKN